MSQLKNRSVIALKPEVTYNVDTVPTAAANAILVENLSWKKANLKMLKRSPVRESFGKVKQLYAGELREVSFDVEVKGSGVAGTAPEIGTLLRTCGFGETIVAVTSVTYKPISSGIISTDLYLWRDGKRQILTGVRGQSLKMGLTAAGAVKLSVTLIGHHVSETDVALPAPTYLATLPVPVLNAALAFDGYTGVLTKFDLDMGLQLSVPVNINSPDGYGELQITDRDVTGAIDPEDVTIATYDFLTKMKANTAFAIGTGLIGATAGNRFQVTCPAASFVDDGPGEKEGGILTRELKLTMAETVALNDEVSFIFT